MRHFITPLILALAFSVAPSYSSGLTKSSVPDVTYRVAANAFKGDSVTVRVKVVVPKGWHIQSNAPLDEFLIPTELKATGEGVRFGTPAFPKPLLKEFPALGGKVALFEDTVEIVLSARGVKAKTSKQALLASASKSTIELRYQACNDSQCLPPKTVVARYVGK